MAIAVAMAIVEGTVIAVVTAADTVAAMVVGTMAAAATVEAASTVVEAVVASMAVAAAAVIANAILPNSSSETPLRSMRRGVFCVCEQAVNPR